MNVGDKVQVNTVINGWLNGIIVAKKEVLGYPIIYNIKINLGKYGEVIEPFLKKRIKKNKE